MGLDASLSFIINISPKKTVQRVMPARSVEVVTFCYVAGFGFKHFSESSYTQVAPWPI